MTKSNLPFMTYQLRKIAVFCGSTIGRNSAYAAAARELGESLAKRKVGLVFGGGSVGLMGELSSAALKARGKVFGFTPHFLLKREKPSYKIDLQLVDTMAERKDVMIHMADAFIVLPGGIGTFEEVFETFSRLQLRQINKAIGFLNVGSFFDPFLKMFDVLVQEGFVRQDNQKLFCVGNTVSELLDKLADFVPFT